MQQYRNHPLTEAARYNDAQAEEIGIDRTIEGCGLTMDACIYVASQRALRAVMAMTRGEEYMRKYSTSPIQKLVPLSEEERYVVDDLTAVYLDGIMIGWKGHILSAKGSDD